MKLGSTSYEDQERIKNALLNGVQGPARSLLLKVNPEPRQLLLCFVYIARTEHSLRRTHRNPNNHHMNVSDLTRFFGAALAMATKVPYTHHHRWMLSFFCLSSTQMTIYKNG